jgi:hypothetical protein
MTDNQAAFPIDHLPLCGVADAVALRIKERSYNYQELNLYYYFEVKYQNVYEFLNIYLQH